LENIVVAKYLSIKANHISVTLEFDTKLLLKYQYKSNTFSMCFGLHINDNYYQVHTQPFYFYVNGRNLKELRQTSSTGKNDVVETETSPYDDAILQIQQMHNYQEDTLQ